ncbi:MAG TPA: CvpA family protein [Candidatus Limiplasma stercoravium]|nr:CvpA family protein [Candidatus Limiplasma stercoravium]
MLGLCVLFGLYRGFIQSVLNLAGGLAAFAGSFWLFPKLADVLSTNTEITRIISTYTDSGTLLGDLDLSSLSVSALSQDSIASIVERANLPSPVDTLLEHNLAQQVFSPLGNLATNVGDYVNQTILSVSINVLCFLLCFVICFVVMTILVNVLRAVFRFPVLKHLDWLAGGVFGLLIGVLLCFVIFTVLPLMESVVPLPEFRELVDQSALAQVFENGNLIISIMNRKL